MKLAPKCCIKVGGNKVLGLAVLGLIESMFPDHRWNCGEKPTAYTDYISDALCVNTGKSGIGGIMGGQFGLYGIRPVFDAATEFGKIVEFFTKATQEPVTLDIKGYDVKVSKDGVQFGCTKLEPSEVTRILNAFFPAPHRFALAAGRAIRMEFSGSKITFGEGSLDKADMERLKAAWETVSRG